MIKTPYYRTTTESSPGDIGQVQEFNYTPYQIYVLRSRLQDYIRDKFPKIDIVTEITTVEDQHKRFISVTFKTKGVVTKFTKNQIIDLRNFSNFITGEEPYISLLYSPEKILTDGLVIPKSYVTSVIRYLTIDYSLKPFYRYGRIFVDASNVANYNDVIADLALEVENKVIKFYKMGAVTNILGPMIKKWKLTRVDKITRPEIKPRLSTSSSSISDKSFTSTMKQAVVEINPSQRGPYLDKDLDEAYGIYSPADEGTVTQSFSSYPTRNVVIGKMLSIEETTGDGLYIPNWKDERITCYYGGLVNFLNSRSDGDTKIYIKVSINNVVRHWIAKAMIKLKNQYYFQNQYFVVIVGGIDEARKIASMIFDIISINEGKAIISILSNESHIDYYLRAVNNINPKYECLTYRLSDDKFNLVFSCYLGTYIKSSTLDSRIIKEKIWKETIKLLAADVKSTLL